MKEFTVILDGPTATAIYSDELMPLLDSFKHEGSFRASHVEQSTRCVHCWMVDFFPLGGGVFFVGEDGKDFRTRKAALDFECVLLKRYLKGDKQAIQEATTC